MYPAASLSTTAQDSTDDDDTDDPAAALYRRAYTAALAHHGAMSFQAGRPVVLQRSSERVHDNNATPLSRFTS